MRKFELPDMDKEHSVTRTFRFKYSLIEKLEKIANENNMSVNRLVTECVEFAIDNLDLKKQEKDK